MIGQLLTCSNNRGLPRALPFPRIDDDNKPRQEKAHEGTKNQPKTRKPQLANRKLILCRPRTLHCNRESLQPSPETQKMASSTPRLHSDVYPFIYPAKYRGALDDQVVIVTGRKRTFSASGTQGGHTPSRRGKTDG